MGWLTGYLTVVVLLLLVGAAVVYWLAAGKRWPMRATGSPMPPSDAGSAELVPAQVEVTLSSIEVWRSRSGRMGDYRTAEGVVDAEHVLSPSGRYFALFRNGGGNEGRWENGRVWLFGPEGELFSSSEMKRPIDVAVSDAGHLIVADHLSPNTPGCWVRVLDRSGAELFSQRHRKNAGGVGISPEGGVAVYATAGPNWAIRVVDVATGALKKIPCTGPFTGAKVSEADRAAWLDTDFPDRMFCVKW